MKKLLALFLVLALSVTMIVGCAPKAPAEDTKPADTTAAADTTADQDDTTTVAGESVKNMDRFPLEGEHKLTFATSKEDADKTVNWVKYAEAVGVDITWQTMTEEQVPLSFMSEEDMADVYYEAWGLDNQQVQEYGKAGVLVDFMEYLDQMPNLKALYEADPNVMSGVLDEEGHAYSLPNVIETLTMGGNLFYVRTDMTKEAGWDTLPTTTEEYLQMIKDLQEHFGKDDPSYIAMVANGPNSMKFNNSYANFFFPAFGELLQTGITTDESQKNIEVGFSSEQFKHYLEFMHECYASGALDPECFVTESATNKAKMAEGSTSINPFATYLKSENFASGEMDFQIMPALSSQYYDQARWVKPNKYSAGPYMLAEKCEDKEAALAFLDACFAQQDDPINDEETLWCISLWLGENTVDFELNEEEGWYSILPHDGYDTGSAWLQIAGSGMAPCLVWPYYENSGTGLMKKALGIRDILRPVGVEVFQIGKLHLTEDEQDIYTDCWTDIKTYVDQMNAAFITGQEDIATGWDKYVQTLDDMGLQDVIDVYQAALDRYYGA